MFELEESIPDVLGLCDRRPDAAVVRVTQGRDARSVCALVPDPRVLDRGFHDVTIIDMGDAVEPAVSEDDLSLHRRHHATLIYDPEPAEAGDNVSTHID